ncbi:breast cancer type 1 susceptibility protein-like [Lytechinus variegatus]|uniref:breast cancer type 1 susceptibility protein-like n=1 Tax=Lytechinus variegatus TaxID=7654 RepID=UPI001BB14590|nr:breast cancer type 1 susceptibility protein-like [Lytechinus variegatus]
MDVVRLKKITDSIGLMQKNLECSICLDLLQDPVSTKCDHQFCNFCVLALLQSSRKPSARCPLCKVIITKRSLTKNEQLDKIVKAVRSVITAVEEDSGLQCSPPRGPVFISQPDPKPREPTPKKKAKGKGQVRSSNVRKTKRKAAETVSVYRDHDSDSSDSDAFELPLVGHTNISSSFPRLKTGGKKDSKDEDLENEEMEKEAEDFLTSLNAAPLSSHGDIVSGHSNELERINNEINLLPINSGHHKENKNPDLDSLPHIPQDPTPTDSEIFSVPAPKGPSKVNNLKAGDQDPYEFIPSQRTPRKVKRKAGRKKNQNGKKEFPILKGRFLKPKRDNKSASSCSESDQENSMTQSKAADKLAASVTPFQESNSTAHSKGQITHPLCSNHDDGGKKVSPSNHPKDAGIVTTLVEEGDLVDIANVVIEDTVSGLDNEGGVDLNEDGNAQEEDKAQPVTSNLGKHPLPITPVVVIRARNVGGNIQGSQQSSEGGGITDSQPVVINRNHGRRVFATTYGKAKNGVDKSPPLDPQERILDWLVSKNAGSDESDDNDDDADVGDAEKRETVEKTEDLQGTGNDQEIDDVIVGILPLEEAPESTPKEVIIVDQLEPAEESKSPKTIITSPKKVQGEVRNGRRRSGRHNKETRIENITLDHEENEKGINDKDSTLNRSSEDVEKESLPSRRTMKQRMKENLKEQTEAAKKESDAAKKESEAAAIKSDWELALELARQFGTEPEHLKAEPTELGGRSSRRRKGKLTIEKVPESRSVRKTGRHAQENQEKGKRESTESLDIDSFETQTLNNVAVKTTVKEKSRAASEKRKANSDKMKASPGSQTNILSGKVLQNFTPVNNILKIPETPCISDPPKGENSLERELPSKPDFFEQPKTKAPRPRKSKESKSSSNQKGESIPESKLTSQLTPPLRRSKRGSLPETLNSFHVPGQVLSLPAEKKEVEGMGEEKSNGRTRESRKILSGASDLGIAAESSVSVIKGTESESREKVIDVAEPPMSSLPLYTEDIPKEDKGSVCNSQRCKGSDTTESIDLEIDSDVYEDPDEALESELPESSGLEKNDVCSSVKQKSLDDEMSIMDCILPSLSSQPHPSVGISPGPCENSSGTASDLGQAEADVSLHKKAEEVITVLSGSSCSVQQMSQASVTVISQAKASGSFPMSLDVNSQPSESLLQPLRKSKRKVSQDGHQGSKLQTSENDVTKNSSIMISSGDKQQVDSPKESGVRNDLQEVQTSSGSANSRPTRRMSRRKRRTFTIDASPAVTEMPNPPSQKVQQVSDSLDQPIPDRTTPTKDVSLSEIAPEDSSHKELSKASKSPQERVSMEVTDEKLQCPQPVISVTRKKSKSLPLSQGQKNININLEDSVNPSLSPSNTSQVSDVCGSSLKLKRKSRSGRRHTQSPVTCRDVEEPVKLLSPSSGGNKFDEKCNKEAGGSSGRRSSGRISKVLSKSGSLPDGSAIPTTPGASEMNEISSNVIIPARTLQQSRGSLHEGAEDDPQQTPGTSPRGLRRSARQSRDIAQNRSEVASSNTVKEDQKSEQKISSQTVECFSVVDESARLTLAEKEESHESNVSFHSVEDIFNLDEESRDMFDEEEMASHQQEEESESMNAEIVFISQGDNARGSSGQVNAKKLSGDSSQLKHEMKKETTRTLKKRPDESIDIEATDDAVVSQMSCQYEDTEAPIPPTPPCPDMSKSRTLSFLHTSGLSKAIAKKKKVQQEIEPDISSLLCPEQDTISKQQDGAQSKSLVMETPSVVSRKRKKVPDSGDKSIADTPIKPKCRSVDQREKGAVEDASNDQGGVQDNVFELDEPQRKTSRKVTSQVIGETQSEPTIKSSNESDEVIKNRTRRRKQVIADDVSDDDDDDDDDNDDDEEEGTIGRPRQRRAKRMVQVGRDEEEESDDELIPCSFLQPLAKDEEDEEEEEVNDPKVLFSDHTDPHQVTDGGSASSEDSCASHHMNLTNASSILSSQSEIMNTQQQEKTREDMQALEAQMAELQAALARERGSRSNDDTNDEEEENGLLVEDTEGASTPDSKRQKFSGRTQHSSPKRTEDRVGLESSSDEEDEMDKVESMMEPRSPSPPPPLSPRSLKKASSSSSMTDSIRSVTNMVEQFRKSSSKKVTTKKRRVEDELNNSSDGGESDDGAVMVSAKSSRSSVSPRTGSARRRSKKRRICSVDSEDELLQDEANSPRNSRNTSVDRTKEHHETVHPVTPPSRTTPRSTPTVSSNRISTGGRPSRSPHGGSHKAPESITPRGQQTPRIHTPADRAARRTPETSSIPSPVDASMRTQRTGSIQSGRRSGEQSVRTPEAGLGPSPRPSSRPMSLIATGLNRLELRQVEQLTSRLANCRFASAFNANTTHVIVKTDSSLVCERTLKYFQGIAARAWIVSFQWVHDSLKARKLLAEEDYEVKGDVVNGLDHHGPKRARTLDGPGFMDKFDLCCIGPFTGLNKDQLVGLCEMCGASTVQHPSLFPYNPGRKAFIIIEPNLDTDRDYQGLQRKFRVPVISREWVLDSIALYKSQPITDYLLSGLTSASTDQPIIDIESDDE